MTTTRRPAVVSGDANAAALSERVRISAIIESAEGKRNPAMAAELALRTSLDVEQAKAILARSPIENPYVLALQKEGPIGIETQPVNFAEDAKAARLKEIGNVTAAINAARRAGRM
jgi:hypothetical protein